MKKLIFIVMSVVTFGAAIAQSNDAKSPSKGNPVLIGNQRSITVSKADLTNSPVLQMPEENKNYHVTSYEISYVPKGKNDAMGPYVIKGDKITTGYAADILNKAQTGDRIYFENIVAVSDDGKQPLKLNAFIKIQ